MPTVWAMRMAAGWGAIATRCWNKLVDAEFYVGMGRLTGFMGVELHVLKVPKVACLHSMPSGILNCRAKLDTTHSLEDI